MNETFHKECPKCGGNANSMCTDEGPEPLGIHIFFVPSKPNKIYAKSHANNI